MTGTDIKILAINTTTLMISFTTVEDVLKLVLLAASIGYTCHKWYLMSKNSNKKTES